MRRQLAHRLLQVVRSAATEPDPATLRSSLERTLPELGERRRVLGFNYDTGERYLSVPDFLPEQT